MVCYSCNDDISLPEDLENVEFGNLNLEEFNFENLQLEHTDMEQSDFEAMLNQL